MSIKSTAAKFFAKKIYNKTQAWVNEPIKTQNKVFLELIQEAKKTQFGIDHHFDTIKSFEDFSKLVRLSQLIVISFVKAVRLSQESVFSSSK